MIDSQQNQDNELMELSTGSNIQKELRQRRSTHIQKSIPLGEEPIWVEQGWEVLRRTRKTLRVRKPKPADQKLEDDLWTLLALMGFQYLNKGRNFKIPIKDGDVVMPPKQIDVFAVDGETALVLECKASEELRSRSLQKDLNETRGLQEPIRAAIRAYLGSHLRVCFVYVTRNIRWSKQDRERAKGNQIRVVRDQQIGYYRKLVDIIGPAARHQLQADLFEGLRIPGLSTTVPALKGKFGSNNFYQFAIEPARLLKLAYVSHRANIDETAIGTYQRLLKKKRLKDIAEHIKKTGGMFPTNVVVNFRNTKRLQFDQSGPSGSDPTVLGTLHLPNSYKSAWVIDGQHRLYGFALSDRAAKSKIPVLAFEGLPREQELKLFVDINNKQVKVPKSLLVQLEPELQLYPDQPEQKLNSLYSRLAVELSQSPDSPLLGRVADEWSLEAKNAPLTLPQLVSGIKSSQLIGSIRNGVPYWSHLYYKDDDSTCVHAKLVLEKYLTLFAEGAPQHWARSKKSERFLCTNLGISALLRVLKAALDYRQSIDASLHYDNLTPDEILGSIADLVRPIIAWFSEEDQSKMPTFRGRYGSGAPLKYGYALMEIIHNKYPDFSPLGLDEYRQEHSVANIRDAQRLITETEDAIRDLTLTVLKARYGEKDDRWWWDGVPPEIRGQAGLRSQSSEEGGQPHEFLELIHYKRIADQPNHWRDDFEPHWTLDESLRSKKEKLAWFERLSKIRNRIFHSGNRYVTNDEREFLENVWVRVTEKWEALQGTTPHPNPPVLP